MNTRICRYEYCENEISATEHGLKRYCCQEHYDMQKNIRSAERPNGTSRRKNKKILTQFYPLVDAGINVTVDMLNACDFDWEYSDNEIEAEDGALWLFIDEYGYTLEEDNTVYIHKG